MYDTSFVVFLLLANWFWIFYAEGSSGLRGSAKLWNDKLLNQSLLTRPDNGSDAYTLVYMEYVPVKLINIDSNSQQVEVAAVMPISWFDPRLEWNPLDYDGLTSMNVRMNEVWCPNIAHLYSADANYNLAGNGDSEFGLVIPSGEVIWQPSSVHVSTCKFDVTKFPFDTQSCYQVFGPWPPGSPIELQLFGTEGNGTGFTNERRMLNYATSNEWELKVVVGVKDFPYIHKNNVEKMHILHVQLILKRKVLYYAYAIIIPCVLMVALVLMAFLIPPEAGEKISFGVTILLTFSVFQLTIDSYIPQTSETTPLLSTGIVVLQIVSALSIITSIIVLRLHHMGAMFDPMSMRMRSRLKMICKIPLMPKYLLKDQPSKPNKIHPSSDNFQDPSNISDENCTTEKELHETDLKPNNSHLSDDNFKQNCKMANFESGGVEELHDPVEEWKLVALVIDRFLFIICTLIVVFMILYAVIASVA